MGVTVSAPTTPIYMNSKIRVDRLAVHRKDDRRNKRYGFTVSQPFIIPDEPVNWTAFIEKITPAREVIGLGFRRKHPTATLTQNFGIVGPLVQYSATLRWPVRKDVPKGDESFEALIGLDPQLVCDAVTIAWEAAREVYTRDELAKARNTQLRHVLGQTGAAVFKEAQVLVNYDERLEALREEVRTEAARLVPQYTESEVAEIRTYVAKAKPGESTFDLTILPLYKERLADAVVKYAGRQLSGGFFLGMDEDHGYKKAEPDEFYLLDEDK